MSPKDKPSQQELDIQRRNPIPVVPRAPQGTVTVPDPPIANPTSTSAATPTFTSESTFLPPSPTGSFPISSRPPPNTTSTPTFPSSQPVSSSSTSAIFPLWTNPLMTTVPSSQPSPVFTGTASPATSTAQTPPLAATVGLVLGGLALICSLVFLVIILRQKPLCQSDANDPSPTFLHRHPSTLISNDTTNLHHISYPSDSSEGPNRPRQPGATPGATPMQMHSAHRSDFDSTDYTTSSNRYNVNNRRSLLRGASPSIYSSSSGPASTLPEYHQIPRGRLYEPPPLYRHSDSEAAKEQLVPVS